SKVPVTLIRERRCNAEWALKLQRDSITAVFDAIDDPYLRTRKDDVDQVVNRIQWVLAEDDSAHPSASDVEGRVVFADDLSPADAVLMHHQNVAAILTGYGGATSHTAILARGLKIPAVVGLNQARAFLRENDEVIVDGRRGVIIIGPSASERDYYRARLGDIAAYKSARKRLLDAPVLTKDGERIVLQANVELSTDLETAQSDGADGIGLYRTESLFMNRADPPDEEEQFEAYAQALSAMRGMPVTIRTMDVGADKQVDGMRPGAPASLNPALGLRAVRLCLREPALFRPQLLAILRASALGPVRLMIPMISTPQELGQVKALLVDCQRELKERGVPFDRLLPVGAMIEVPAAAVCADLFARELDFLSIGTNDLIQYTIAVDRVDDEVNYLYDSLHPAVLRLIRMTIQAGDRAGIPVSMCGEMAGDTRVTRLLLGMGLRDFSVHPNALLEIKQIISESHIPELRRLAKRVLRAGRLSTREGLLEQINRDHFV
ncbi:MAG: phosphoenolpyruvate--protein phosphotransferase, partial [Gammaproteobacteria bacterium]|nr:phosphoenolpyruvate--protein phosphotransferase [Gammaproteobacteria bacterium]